MPAGIQQVENKKIQRKYQREAFAEEIPPLLIRQRQMNRNSEITEMPPTNRR